MKAEEKTLNEIFHSGPQKLVVPFFQRRYVWECENWDELLNTIEDNDEVKVFLGSIILKWSEEHEPSSATIVDGQQRLTTISLLTKALYDELDDNNRHNCKDIILGALSYKDSTIDPVEKSHIKIEHSRVDRTVFDYVIRAGLINGDSIELESMQPHCTGQIGACYFHYRQRLSQKSQGNKTKILDTMYKQNNKMLVRIELDAHDINEQTIFDTINRAGAKLSTADIIKNNLFKGILDVSEGNCAQKREIEQLYDEKWDKIFYKEEGENEWDIQRSFGNVKHNNLEFLLYCVACINWAKPETKDIFSTLEKIYDTKTRGYTYEEYKQLLDEIYIYARIFKKYIIDFGKRLADKEEVANLYFKPQEHVKRILFILEHFGVQMFYPYVLKELKRADCKFEDTELIRRLRILEAFVVRRRIKGTGVSDYTPKCYQILNNGVEKLFQLSGDRDISINDGDIRSSLTSVKGDTAKVLLFGIELARRNKYKDEDALTFTYTLEHIMPQSWHEKWSVEEEKVENRENHIHDFGNMTLIKGTLNSVIKNEIFKLKINGKPAEGKKRMQEGYRGNISLSITSEIVESYDAGDHVWDEMHIDKRRLSLGNELLALWPITKAEEE